MRTCCGASACGSSRLRRRPLFPPLSRVERTRPSQPRLALAHQVDEALEQIMAVARAGRSFGVILHREDRLAFELDAGIGAVEQRDMRLLGLGRERVAVDREAVVHRGDLDLAGGLVLHRMVGAVMALMHLQRLGADREAEHLVAEADPEGRHVLARSPAGSPAPHICRSRPGRRGRSTGTRRRASAP